MIGAAGENLGVMPLYQALQLAREHSTDLVEVNPTAVPPVCRLLDYGRYKYEQAKKERDARKSVKTAGLREVRFRPKIDEHDVQVKSRHIREFLDEGDKVKISVMFRGREITHPELGRELLSKLASAFKDVASIEGSGLMEGRSITVILSPLKQAKEAKVAKEAR